MKHLRILIALLIAANLLVYCTKSDQIDISKKETNFNSTLQSTNERATCTTGTCNWTIEIASLPMGATRWQVDVTRLLCNYQTCQCNTYSCENTFRWNTHNLNTLYNVPVLHTSRLEFSAVASDNAGNIISGDVVVIMRRPAPSTVSYTINVPVESATAPWIIGSCENMTIPGCQNDPPGGGDDQ